MKSTLFKNKFMNPTKMTKKIFMVLTYHIVSLLAIVVFNLLLEFMKCPISYEIYSIPQYLVFIFVCYKCFGWIKQIAVLACIIGQLIYIPILIYLYPAIVPLCIFANYLADNFNILTNYILFISPAALLYMCLIATPLNILGIIIYYTVKKYYPRLLRKQ